MSESAPTTHSLAVEEVAKVADLAMLDLADDDLERFRGQLEAVLELARQLDEFDIDDVPPTAHPFGLTNVLRPDTTVDDESLEALRQQALSAGPAIEEGRYKVPPALGEAP